MPPTEKRWMGDPLKNQSQRVGLDSHWGRTVTPCAEARWWIYIHIYIYIYIIYICVRSIVYIIYIYIYLYLYLENTHFQAGAHPAHSARAGADHF